MFESIVANLIAWAFSSLLCLEYVLDCTIDECKVQIMRHNCSANNT